MHTGNLCYSKYDYEVTNRQGLGLENSQKLAHIHHSYTSTVSSNQQSEQDQEQNSDYLITTLQTATMNKIITDNRI